MELGIEIFRTFSLQRAIRKSRTTLQILRKGTTYDNLTRTTVNPLLREPDDSRVIYGGQRVSNQLERAKSRLRPAICERRPGRLFRIEGVVSYGLLAPILRAITDITLSRRAPECYRSTTYPSRPTPSPIRLPLPLGNLRRRCRTFPRAVAPSRLIFVA